MQFGGVIYNDSADKATRFIANCNQKKIPLVFLQDVTGFMVGSKSEHGGIIKDGAVMSGNSAAKVLLQIETASLKKKGEKITPEKEEELFNKIKDRYDNQVSPYYAAARLWTDGVIDPLNTRTWISMGIEAANHAPIEKSFNLGVIQV